MYKMNNITLNDDQKIALGLVKEGKTVAILSQGGTGKTTFLTYLYGWCKTNGKKLSLTSSTGTSALTLGSGRARTLHSLMGVGLAQKSADQLAWATMRKNKQLVKKLQQLDILGLDEISMHGKIFFDKISDYMSILRKDTRPFGGVQLVITGDFFQLPPVNDDFAFESGAWEKIDFHFVEFNVQVRQQDDLAFAKILSNARIGELTDEDFSTLKNNPKPDFGTVRPTILYSTNMDVDRINFKNYDDLVSKGFEDRIYKTTYSEHSHVKAWADSLKIPEKTELCVGAQVMLTINLSLDIGLANGSRGIIVAFEPDGAIVEFTDGEQYLIEQHMYMDEDEIMWAVTIPLKLSWAMTIHKSQSSSLDCLITNLAQRIFEKGQAYVALSRCRTLRGVEFIDIAKDSFIASETVKKFYTKLKYENK